MNVTSNNSILFYYLIFIYTRILILITSLLSSFFPFWFPKNVILVNANSGKNECEILNFIILRYSGNLITKTVGSDCKFYSFKYFMFLVRSRVWLTNISMLYTTSWKSNNCKYINIWHGTPIVNIGNKATKFKYKYYKLNNVDLFPISSDYERILFSESLGIKNSKFLLSKNIRQCLYEMINKTIIKTKKNILFYAPSWRDQNVSDTLLSLDKLNKISDDLNLNLVISLHYKVKKEIKIPNNIRVLEPNESREKILKETHIFISDYSSLVSDAARNQCNILLYISDFNKIKLNRNFYLQNLSNECYQDEKLLLSDLKKQNFSKFKSGRLLQGNNETNPLNFIINFLNE